MIISINIVPPIAPDIIGKALVWELVAVGTVLLVIGGGDEIDIVDDTRDKSRELVYLVVDDTIVTVGNVVYDDPLALDTVIILNNEN